MSKAFTKESENNQDLLPAAKRASLLPPGTKNYMTAHGEKTFRAELDRLLTIERPKLLSELLNDPDSKRHLQILNQRIEQLQQCLQSAEVVPPPEKPDPQVRFGSTVTIRAGTGPTISYRIVGVDEIDIDKGWISWISPIARALMHAKAGQRVRFKTPSGEKELEVVAVGHA